MEAGEEEGGVGAEGTALTATAWTTSRPTTDCRCCGKSCRTNPRSAAARGRTGSRCRRTSATCCIYVERSEGKTLPRKRSRPQKTDRWDQKMYLWTRQVGQRDKRGEVWVRCSYGYVNRRDRRGEMIQGATPLYHEYQLLFFQVSTSA